MHLEAFVLHELQVTLPRRFKKDQVFPHYERDK